MRWLTGVHEAGEQTYLVREPYEEFLWWLQMPELLHIAAKPSPNRAEVLSLSNKVRETLANAEKAGYRLQAMLGEDEHLPAPEEEVSTAKLSPLEAVNSKPEPGRKSEASRFADDAKSVVDSKTQGLEIREGNSTQTQK